MSSYSVAEARDNLCGLIREALDDRSVIIRTEGGNVVMMSERYWDEVSETLYLLGDPEFMDDVIEAEMTPEDEYLVWNDG